MKYNNVSLFIIGTELTRGIIEDKHTSRICNELAHMGFEILRSIIVPDDGSIEKMLDFCILDSDVVIITGGLGPTSDDMTRKIIADEAHVELVKNAKAWDTLYQRVGERIRGANEQQTMIPKGFSLLENPFGTAPGFLGFVKKEGRDILIVSMPGPPREMQPMFFNLVVPYLSGLEGHNQEERDEFSVYLVAESKLEELCRQCARPGVAWGTRFQSYRISLYIFGGSAEDRHAMEDDLRNLVGKELMIDGDAECNDTLGDALAGEKMTVSTSESCTSGLLSVALTERSGASKWYWGGVSVYCEEAKTKLSGVPSDVIQKHSVYSHECVISMAEGIRSISETDLAIAVSGVAGPDGGTLDNPVGTVYFGFASKNKPSQSVKLVFSSNGRDYIRRRAVSAASILAFAYMQNEQLLDITSKWQYI